MEQASNPLFDHVLIVGVGLLGASLGLALKSRGLARRITGVGRPGSASLRIALERHAIDAAGAIADAATADLVVLCSPVRSFQPALQELAPLLKPNAIITDVGSTKADVMHWALAAMPKGRWFVGSHPMAGSEKRGPEFARDDLYQNALCLICSQPDFEQGRDYAVLAPDTQAAGMYHAVLTVERLWQKIGMRTLRVPADLHDRWVAAVSHLPHAVATCLVLAASEDPAALQAAAGGFIDTTRIASGDVEMWTDIFLTNRTAIVNRLTVFESQIRTLINAVERGDEAAIRHHLEQAKRTRDDFMRQRGK